MSRDLVYYVIGGNSDYVQVLRTSIDSLRTFNPEVDVVIMCDENYASYVEEMLQSIPYKGIEIHLTPSNATHIIASMRKTEIFQYPSIWNYDRVLYLDCDICVGSSLAPIFNGISKDDVLYVVPEGTDFERHKCYYYSRADRPYDDQTLGHMQDNGIYVFNAGQFGFKVSATMQKHFKDVCQDKMSYDASIHFYEQSFMNAHFNPHCAVSYDIEKYVRLTLVPEVEPSIVIYHFCGCGTPYTEKLQKMQQLFKNLLTVS